MTLANRSTGLSPEALLKCFISGLNIDIHRNVIVQCPTTLLGAVSLAKLYEEKYKLMGLPGIPIIFTSIILFPIAVVVMFLRRQLLLIIPYLYCYLHLLQSLFDHLISRGEMQLQRDKGLYYFCDDKFTFNH